MASMDWGPLTSRKASYSSIEPHGDLEPFDGGSEAVGALVGGKGAWEGLHELVGGTGA